MGFKAGLKVADPQFGCLLLVPGEQRRLVEVQRERSGILIATDVLKTCDVQNTEPGESHADLASCKM